MATNKTTLRMPTEAPKRYRPGFLRNLDKRSATSRQLRADFNAIVADLGGEANLSRVMLGMIERYVWLVHILSRLERAIEQKPKDSEHVYNRWVQGCNSAQGLAVKIGLKRAKSAGGGTLKDYLKDRRA